MKDLKNHGVTSKALLATSLFTTLSYLSLNTATAQSQETTVDIETCQALNDSTSLDQKAIENRIACYSRDVQKLNQLVEQLVEERNQLVGISEEKSAAAAGFQQELAQRQTTMQRLEQRAATLTTQIDELTADRNQLREQLFSVLSEGQDRTIDVEANELLFESFSRTYVTQSEEIEELKRKLKEFEDKNTELAKQQDSAQEQNQQLTAGNQELESQNQELDSQNQELQSNIATLEQSVSDLNDQKALLQSDLEEANRQIESMKNQLMDNAELTTERLSQISDLKSALADSEAEREKLAAEISALNENHLAEVATLNKQTEKLNANIETLKTEQLALQDQASAANDELQSRVKVRNEKILELARTRFQLNSEREQLVAKIASMETDFLQKTQGFQDKAGQLDAQISALTIDNSSLDEALQNQQSENEQLRARARDNSAQLYEVANSLRAKFDKANSTATNLQANIDKLEDQSDGQKALFLEQLAKLNTTIEQNQKDQNMLTGELDAIKPALATAEKDLQSANARNESLSAEIQSLEQQLEKAADEQQGLQATLTATEEESVETNNKLAALRKDTDTLQSLLAMSRTHGKNADNTLAELRKELSASDDRLSSKQDELAALLAEKNRIENEFKDMASLASNQAQTIKTAMSEAGHDNVEVEVGDDNTIGILLGSGQLFRTGSSSLSSDGQRVLTELAKSFESIENRRIMISGHSDDVPLGAKLQEVFKDNWGLSLARALATAEFFTDNAGITADRMSVTGFGATQPVASNDTPEGRQQNRRVEIRLTPETDKMASAE